MSQPEDSATHEANATKVRSDRADRQKSKSLKQKPLNFRSKSARPTVNNSVTIVEEVTVLNLLAQLYEQPVMLVTS